VQAWPPIHAMLFFLIIAISLVGADVHPECETDYHCFAPDDCTDGRVLITVAAGKNVDSSCFVFLKIHPYSTKWFRIRMESFSGASKIELNKRDGTNLLTCAKTSGVKQTLQGNGIVIKEIDRSKTGKLYCDFEVFLGDSNILPNTDSESLTLKDIVVTTSDQTTVESDINPKIFCKPSDLVASTDNYEENKFYGKTRYDWGNVVCNEPNVYNTIEYHKDGTDEYSRVTSLKCEKNQVGNKYNYKLVLDGAADPIVFNEDDDIEVRCVADVEYFCDYDLKYTKDEQPLNRQRPDRTSDIPKKGNIQCPKSHPFFVIRGQPPIIHPEETKCRNHRGKPKWTYNNTVLSKTSPEVHCLDKLDCHFMNKIKKTNLEGSFLNEKFVPTCQDGGKLTVKEGREESDLMDVTCDGTTGYYNYTYTTDAGNLTRLVSDATVFKCTYKIDLSPNAAFELWLVGITVLYILILVPCTVFIVRWILNDQKHNEEIVARGLDRHRKESFNLSERMDTNVEVATQKSGAESRADTNKMVPKAGQATTKEPAKKDEENGNDYINMMRTRAAEEIKVEVIAKEIPVNANRVKARVTQEFRDNRGVRYTDKRVFVKPSGDLKNALIKTLVDRINKVRGLHATEPKISNATKSTSDHS
ncbi:hypothetical protein PFISCL1PPCAC_7904, partial [Pristionchus fissidentatus]